MAVKAANPEAIAEAGRLLRAGGLVAFPTETVYGLGADAMNGRAVAGIFEAKGRPQFNPLIVHVPDLATAETIGEFGPAARRLADAFWPGPLTLVLTRRADCGISDLVSAGLPSIALRVPAHPVAQQVLAAAGRPLAAPSANRSGRVSPTRAQHVAHDLGDRPALILDGGAPAHGLESTIVDVRDGLHVTLLRAGAVPRETIEAELGSPLDEGPETDDVHPTAPGQLSSHYAPNAGLRLNALSAGPLEALLAFGPDAPRSDARSFNLSPRGDLAEAAANLFAALRDLDRPDVTTIAVMPIPSHGLGEAINDRLRRAAAPRPPHR